MIQNISDFLSLIATVIGSVTAIGGIIAVCVSRSLKGINKKIDDIKAEMTTKDILDCKVRLNTFLNKVEYDSEKIDEEEWQLYHYLYDHYTNELHQNSYIHDKWNRIVNKSK